MGHVPVVQWTERQPSKLHMHVRFVPGTPAEYGGRNKKKIRARPEEGQRRMKLELGEVELGFEDHHQECDEQRVPQLLIQEHLHVPDPLEVPEGHATHLPHTILISVFDDDVDGEQQKGQCRPRQEEEDHNDHHGRSPRPMMNIQQSTHDDLDQNPQKVQKQTSTKGVRQLYFLVGVHVIPGWLAAKRGHEIVTPQCIIKETAMSNRLARHAA